VGINTLDELIAHQLCVRFKRAVYALVRKHPEAFRDYKWRDQLWSAVVDAEADIAEGWRRWRKNEMCQFLRYALASLEEAQRRLIDGVHRGYYREAECEPVLTLGRRTGAATMALMRSLQ